MLLTVYILCFVAGGVLIAMSIMGVGDLDVDTDAAVGSAGEGVAAVARMFSLRGLIFGAAFFGLTGALFTMLRVGPLLTLAFAFAWAAVAAASIQRLMGYLAASESGAVADRDLSGSLAEVVVGVTADRSGKVAIARDDCTIQLVARLHVEAASHAFHPGDEVVIVEVVDGTAYVVGGTFVTEGRATDAERMKSCPNC